MQMPATDVAPAPPAASGTEGERKRFRETKNLNWKNGKRRNTKGSRGGKSKGKQKRKRCRSTLDEDFKAKFSHFRIGILALVLFSVGSSVRAPNKRNTTFSSLLFFPFLFSVPIEMKMFASLCPFLPFFFLPVCFIMNFIALFSPPSSRRLCILYFQ